MLFMQFSIEIRMHKPYL